MQIVTGAVVVTAFVLSSMGMGGGAAFARVVDRAGLEVGHGFGNGIGHEFGHGGAPGGASPVKADGSLQEALNSANAERRVLVVALGMGARQREAADKLWSSAGLAAWAAKHARVYAVSQQADFQVMSDLEAVPTGANVDPICFLDSKQLRLFGSGLPQRASRVVNPKSEPAMGTMLKLDWTLLKKVEADAGLAGVHGEAGVREWDADGAELRQRLGAALDLSKPIAAEVDAAAWIARLHAAKRTLADEKAEASAKRAAERELVTLWATGIGQTTLLGARHTVLGRELAARVAAGVATAKGDGAAAKPDGKDGAKGETSAVTDLLRSARAALLGSSWHRDGALCYELLMLSRVLGDEEPLRFIDDALSDPDVVLLMPLGERLKYELMLPQANFNAPGGDAAATLKAQLARLGDAKPERLTAEQFELVQKMRAHLLHAGAARDVAMLVAGGKPESTAAAGKVISAIAGANKPSLSVAAAAACLAAGYPEEAKQLLVGVSGAEAEGLRGK